MLEFQPVTRTAGGTVPVLPPGELHIWKICLQAPADAAWHALAHTLTPDEQQRAERFRFESDRSRFINARGWMRIILGGYLGVSAREIRFAYGHAGKPVLSNPLPDNSAMAFNLSHSQELALLAVADTTRLGIDIEKRRLDFPGFTIARQFFAEKEVAALHAMPDEQRQEAFWYGWTRKEAWIKALGDGLSFPLKQFEVSLDPEPEAALLEVLGHPLEASRWQLFSFVPEVDYLAAVAIEGREWRTRYFQLTEFPDL